MDQQCRLEIASNTIERVIQPLTLNWKNALFAGSDGGGEHWAVIASLIETCKLVGVEPQAYMTDVITRIVEGHRQRRLDDLLPWAYPSTSTLQTEARIAFGMPRRRLRIEGRCMLPGSARTIERALLLCEPRSTGQSSSLAASTPPALRAYPRPGRYARPSMLWTQRPPISTQHPSTHV